MRRRMGDSCDSGHKSVYSSTALAFRRPLHVVVQVVQVLFRIESLSYRSSFRSFIRSFVRSFVWSLVGVSVRLSDCPSVRLSIAAGALSLKVLQMSSEF